MDARVDELLTYSLYKKSSPLRHTAEASPYNRMSRKGWSLGFSWDGREVLWAPPLSSPTLLLPLEQGNGELVADLSVRFGETTGWQFQRQNGVFHPRQPNPKGGHPLTKSDDAQIGAEVSDIHGETHEKGVDATFSGN